MTGKITISNQTPAVAVIDVEGVIGVPEQWQFEEPGERIATYETFRKAVERIREVSAAEVVVNIRSTGGNVNDALLIYDALTALPAKITTRCFGYVASAATIIAQAASAGGREISSNALYLIHKSMSSAEGNREELARTADMLAQTDERIASIYASRSGKSAGQFVALMEENAGKGRWLSPAETLEFALADRVTASSAIAADAAREVEELGLPPIPGIKMRGKSGLSRHWNAILEKLGVNAAGSSEASLAESPAAQDDVLESMAQAQVEMAENHRLEIARLESQISSLEASNARLSVGATTTKPKEDPSPQQAQRSPNQSAYDEDARRLR